MRAGIVKNLPRSGGLRQILPSARNAPLRPTAWAVIKMKAKMKAAFQTRPSSIWLRQSKRLGRAGRDQSFRRPLAVAVMCARHVRFPRNELPHMPGGSMAGLFAPLPTLRCRPHGRPRTARGQCGSLLPHRVGLAPTTRCRSPGALRKILDMCGRPPGRKKNLLDDSARSRYACHGRACQKDGSYHLGLAGQGWDLSSFDRGRIKRLVAGCRRCRKVIWRYGAIVDEPGSGKPVLDRAP